MVVKPVGSSRLITQAQRDSFEQALAADSGLVVRVTAVDRYAEALAALCASNASEVTVAWLDGISYAAAVAQNCGKASLQVERRGGGRQLQTGDTVSIVGGRQLSLLGSRRVQALSGRDFCRLGIDDYETWLVPSLMMLTSGVDPVSELDLVRDVDTLGDLVDAVAAGDCTATGLYQAHIDDLDQQVQDELNVLDTSPAFPYGILMYPVSIPLGERIRLDDALLAVDNSSALKPFLDQDGLRRVSETAFDDLNDFLNSTGLDFAQLGT